MFFEMEHFFLERWRAVNVKANERETPLVQNPERENLSQFFR
jgi:hypothetical protein